MKIKILKNTKGKRQEAENLENLKIQKPKLA
jgi:hypothetical protein